MAAPRSGRHTGCLHHWQSSVERRSHRYREPAPTLVGAGLARDGSTAIRQAYRVACITGNRASSCAPTDTRNPHQPLWEPGLPAMTAPRSRRHTGLPASLAIERRTALPQIPGTRTNLCGSRACPRWQHRDPAGIPGCLHHWQSSVEWRSHRYRGTAPTLVGVGLARDGSTAIRQAYRVHASLTIERRAALPQIPGTRTNLCGSRACPRWQHRDPAGIQGACITGNRASSGAPTDTGNPHQPLWEPGLPAMAAPRSGRHTGRKAHLPTHSCCSYDTRQS